MPSEEVERELKTLWKKWQDEERQTQTPPVQISKKSITKEQLKALLREPEPRGDRPSPRYIYSYADHPSKDILVQINEDLLNRAKEEASRRKMSLSSYIRECLMYRLYKISPEQELEIENLLEECTIDGRFIVEGEKGFINQVAEKGLIGNVWTPSQIDKVALRLSTSPRSIEEQCLEAMKLDKVQTQYFRTQIEYVRSTQPKEEVTFFVPFGICNQCLRPLTKEQYNLPQCPYCKGTKGTEFVYDKKASAQPKPYAMCKECHRPLPKEAEKWKECKYCGTTEKEIVLEYEGIQRQTPSSTLTIPKETLEKLAESEDLKETEES